MNIAKNMEALFVIAIALAGATSFATAAVPKFHAAPNARLSAAVADASAMQTVLIVGKRLSAAEKAAL